MKSERKGGMTIEAKTLRARARANLAGNWGISVAVAVVAVLLGGLMQGTSFLPDLEVKVPFSTPAIQAFPDALQKFADSLNKGIQIGNFTLTFRSGVFGLAAFILGGTLQLGYATEKKPVSMTCFPNLITSVPASPSGSCAASMLRFGACCSSSPVSSRNTAMP